MTVTVILISVILGLIRISGHKSQSFQALAHLWVGGLFAYGIWAGGRVELWCAVALTVVETACFFVLRVLRKQTEYLELPHEGY